jgi:hypothetical protein
MSWRAISGRPCGAVLSKELTDVFEREVLPRLVGPEMLYTCFITF